MLQDLTDHTRQHLATDRFAGGKDHRLDPQHPFTPTQVPAANPQARDRGDARLPDLIALFAWISLRSPASPSQPENPERGAAGEFTYRAKTFQPFEQPRCGPTGEMAAGGGGRHGILVE